MSDAADQLNQIIAELPPRLRVLELPMQHHGEHTETPFALVLDRIPDPQIITEDVRTDIAKAVGARALIAFRGTLSLNGLDEEPTRANDMG